MDNKREEYCPDANSFVTMRSGRCSECGIFHTHLSKRQLIEEINIMSQNLQGVRHAHDWESVLLNPEVRCKFCRKIIPFEGSDS